MEPDPKCSQCHGTGKIELFTSVIACECLFFWNGMAKVSKQPKADIDPKLSSDGALYDHGNGD